MNPPEAEPSSPALTANDRRHHRRYTVHVQIEIRQERSAIPMRLQTTDLSRGGCYVELMMPLPVGACVQATLWLGASSIVIRGRVVTCHPNFGNGIMFTEFDGQAEQLLNLYLDAVTTETSVP